MVATQTFPSKLEPPFRDKALDADGYFSQAWVAWLTFINNRRSVGNVGVVRAGQMTSDGAGVVTVAFDPPFLNGVAAVYVFDFTGGAQSLSGITADAVGFTATMNDSGPSPLPSYTANFYAIGY